MIGIGEEDLRGLCTAIGMLTIMWANTERQIDNTTYLVFNQLGGVPGQTVKPFALAKKIEYLRAAFKKNIHLIGHKQHALSLLVDTKETGDKRHRLLHGNLAKLEGHILTVHQLAPGSSDYGLQATRFNLRDFPALAEEFADLGIRWGQFAQTLLREHQAREAKP